jgi:hypothetical protein
VLEFLGYFWLGVVYTILFRILVIRLYHWQNRRRNQRFMKHLRVKYPGGSLTLSSIESSDREALNKIKEQLDEL